MPKKSFLNAFLTKAEVAKANADLEHALDNLGKMTAGQWQKIGRDIERQDNGNDDLAELIGDAKLLIENCGYTVPRDQHARSRVEKEASEFVLRNSPQEFLDAIKSGTWRNDPKAVAVHGVVLDAICSLAWSQNDPETLLFSAYKSFMASAELRDKGDFALALNRVSLGASFLIRAAFSLQIAQRKRGGLAKQETPQAKLKAAAIAESRAFWNEREAGKYPKLRTEDQFAVEVARRWPIIASISAIKKRSAEWRAKKKRAAKS